MNAVEDDVGVHEVSRKLAYHNDYDGITRCGQVFFWRHPPEYTGKMARLLNAAVKDRSTIRRSWLLVSSTTAVVTCIECLGAEPWH